MPEVSRFFGIINSDVFYSDHEPAHFDAIYGEYEALIEIDTLMVRGSLPRALALVLESAALHRSELRDDWRHARRRNPKREPLD